MYLSWLDKFDERRAQRSDHIKHVINLVLNAPLAFPNAPEANTIEDFCVLAQRANHDPTFFRPLPSIDEDYDRNGAFIDFSSDITTDVPENNTVWTRITEAKSSKQVMVIFHHWNASSRNQQIANFFFKRGITVVEMAMPYHFERKRPESNIADYMLSSDLGRTIQAMRQAVLDGSKLIRWLKQEGYEEISVFGMSLGSWVAALVAAFDTNVSNASLFLTGGSLADMVWTGRATRHIRQGVEQSITLEQFNLAWSPLNLENYTKQLSRPSLNIQIVLAKRDKVVLPQLTHEFIRKLKEAGARPDILQLNCGHYSLAIPPYILVAAWRLKEFIKKSR